MRTFILSRIRSFVPAIQGIIYILRFEKNTWIHLSAALAAVLLSAILHIDSTEWLFILTAIFIVLIAELINSAIEKTVDMISLEKNRQAKMIKDMSAGFVLLAAAYSVICGLIIFLPKLLGFLK